MFKWVTLPAEEIDQPCDYVTYLKISCDCCGERIEEGDKSAHIFDLDHVLCADCYTKVFYRKGNNYGTE